MRVEIRARLLFRDADAREHVLLLHAIDQHLLFERLAQPGNRQAFLLQRRLELLLGIELVLLADVREDAVELLVAHLEPELAPALDEQQFVDGVDDDARRDLVEHLAQRDVVLQVGRRDVRVAGAQRRHLQLFDVRLGEDLAVDLHQHLLDHVGAQARDRQPERQPEGPENTQSHTLHRFTQCNRTAQGSGSQDLRSSRLRA